MFRVGVVISELYDPERFVPSLAVRDGFVPVGPSSVVLSVPGVRWIEVFGYCKSVEQVVNRRVESSASGCVGKCEAAYYWSCGVHGFDSSNLRSEELLEQGLV